MYGKVAKSHPMVSVVASRVMDSDVNTWSIMPADVAVITLQESDLDCRCDAISLQFSYGPCSMHEKPIGTLTVKKGSALSFVSFDNDLRLRSVQETSKASAEPFIVISNCDLLPVDANVYSPEEDQSLFSSSLLTETIGPGKR